MSGLKQKLKENILALIAFVVAVTVIVLWLTIDINTIKGWVLGTQIEVISADRGPVQEFLAGEKLKFKLKEIKSTKVVWIFEESSALIGDIEIEYVFSYRDDLPIGQAKDRRIDAFFKEGDKYRVATSLVRTRNVVYSAKAEISYEKVALLADPIFSGIWSLEGVAIGKYTNGTFTEAAMLPFVTTKSGFKVYNIDEQITKAAVWPSEISDKDWKVTLKNTNNLWASYSFLKPGTKERLTLVKPLFRF